MKDILAKINESYYTGKNEITVRQNGNKVDILNLDGVAAELLLLLLEGFKDGDYEPEPYDEAWEEAAQELIKQLKKID